MLPKSFPEIKLLFFKQKALNTTKFDVYLKKYIKNVFGFRAKNIHLYRLALTHKSCNQESNRENNERLEFLGDAILQSVTTSYLFQKYPCKGEGFLTELRSKIVCRNNLNKVACSIGLNDLISCNLNGIPRFHSNIYGDALEALIGAIYLDKGYKFTEKLIYDRLIKLYIDIDSLNEKLTNFKSKLLEWSQKEKKNLKYHIVSEPDNQNNIKTYKIAILIDDELIAEGIDYSIKKAEQNAAEKAILILDIV